MSRRITAGLCALTVSLLAAPVLIGTQAAAALTQQQRRAPATNGPFTDWPELHHDPGLTGTTGDPALSTANAGSLGISWMTNTTGPVLASPVVAHSSDLGKTLVYTANDNGDVEAMDLATGEVVWSVNLGYPVVATPLVVNGSVWVGTELNPQLVKLDASTGAQLCSVPARGKLDSSPTAGAGPNGALTIYEGVLDTASTLGPTMAVDAASCTVRFSVTPQADAGPWNPVSYAADANGDGRVFIGTADPDNSVYALDARTGAKAWSFSSLGTSGDNDFAAGETISPPGANGIADGAAYIPGKDGILYANDLTTGASLWTLNFSTALGGGRVVGRSTAALAGSTLVFGTTAGVVAVDVLTHQVLWHVSEPNGSEVLSSPAVVGPAGSQVVVVADLGGAARVLDLATGAQLYATNLGGYMTASPAVSDGNVVLASSNGFVYDLSAGGGNAAAGSAAITAPDAGSTLLNKGTVRITGTASDPHAVRAVRVAVQEDGSTGPWWDGAAGRWADGPTYTPADLSAPGSGSTGWSLSVPVPPEGATIRVLAYEQSSTGPSSSTAAQRSFTVAQATSTAFITPSVSVVSPLQTFTVQGGHFAAGEKVALSLPRTPLGTPAADGSGGLRATVSVPAAVHQYGSTLLKAVGQSSGEVASFPIDVTNNWPQPGQSSLHTGVQPNDQSLSLASPSQQYTFARVWLYPGQSAVAGSAAVFDNVAYVGDASGHLTALALQTGVPLWSHQAPGAIATAPVYDAGSVFVSAAGRLVAVDARTGTQRWSVPATSAGSSLTVAGGVVYVAAADHSVTAVSASGASLWHQTVPGAVSAPVSVDPSAGLVIVGDSTGAVSALRSATGALAWRVKPGGAVATSPTVVKGSVVVGTSTGRVESLAELTGAKHWVTTIPGPAGTSATVQGLDVIIGDTSGSLNALLLATGRHVASVNDNHHPFTGVAATVDRVVATTSDGWTYALRGVSSWGEGFIYRLLVGGKVASGPVIVNNEVLVAGLNGNVWCLTPAGSPPE
ncbi:MAG: eukaryotic-like serine/threonine-protein kinase [Nocardioidaceae bacterium]|jgi:outer membrane protein assembly factor BamB|nr:eukaryotic-like serine/threonine-protein kinase [Nocardioidaceae bacterium]